VNPLFEAMVEAGVQAGYPRTDDLNGYQQEGGPMDRTVTPQGRRASTARGYLDQAPRPNLTIRTHAMTDRIIFDGKRAVGVEWLEGESTIPSKATANKEVLLCAGAIASPQIPALRRGQRGAAEAVRYPAGARSARRGRKPAGSPGDVPPVRMQRAGLPLPCPAVVEPAEDWRRVAVWRHRLGASNHFEAGGFIRSREEFEWPNIQYHFLPVAINYNGSNAVKEHGFQCHVGSMRSPSRGHVRMKSRDPHPSGDPVQLYVPRAGLAGVPRRDPHHPRDHAPAGAGQVSRSRNQSGRRMPDRCQLDEFVRNHAETAFHPCGTCKMGYDEMAVVDGEGRVHGLEGCAWWMRRSCRRSSPAT
jgi:choline dehydrogenase